MCYGILWIVIFTLVASTNAKPTSLASQLDDIQKDDLYSTATGNDVPQSGTIPDNENEAETRSDPKEFVRTGWEIIEKMKKESAQLQEHSGKMGDMQTFVVGLLSKMVKFDMFADKVIKETILRLAPKADACVDSETREGKSGGLDSLTKCFIRKFTGILHRVKELAKVKSPEDLNGKTLVSLVSLERDLVQVMKYLAERLHAAHPGLKLTDVLNPEEAAVMKFEIEGNTNQVPDTDTEDKTAGPAGQEEDMLASPGDGDDTSVGPPDDGEDTDAGPVEYVEDTEAGPVEDVDDTEIGPVEDVEDTETGPTDDAAVGPTEDGEDGVENNGGIEVRNLETYVADVEDNGRMDEHVGDVTENGEATESLGGGYEEEVADNEDDVAEHEEDVAENEEEVAENQDEVSENQDEVSENGREVAKIEREVAEIEEEVAEIEEEVAAEKVGNVAENEEEVDGMEEE